MTDEVRTGLFYRKSTDDYVVLWKGQYIAGYDSIEAFVEAHELGLRALDSSQADLLASFYRTGPGKS